MTVCDQIKENKKNDEVMEMVSGEKPTDKGQVTHAHKCKRESNSALSDCNDTRECIQPKNKEKSSSLWAKH